MGFVAEGKALLRKNIREYGMYIALVFIMLIFTVLTDGLFMSSRNISNLINQMGYIAVLAVGMTLIIVIKHIDLSVGYMAGFLGAICAILLSQLNVPLVPALIIIMILGIFLGLVNGFLVAQFGIPAFVASLATMFVFRGALLQATLKTGTIIVKNDNFNKIGNGFIPDIVHVEGLHILTLVVGILAIILFVFTEINNRNKKLKYNFEVLSGSMFTIKLVFISAIILYIVWVLANYNGLSWTVVVVLVVVVIYHFITTKTVLGRRIYAVGGNIESAKFSGINVKKITYIVFGSMGLMAALAGILFTSRLQSATTTAGTLFELDAIAAAYVGGVSADGGVGKITGSIIGALVMASLSNGMNLMGIDISFQYIIRGAVLAIAVIFDVTTRRKR
jgi:putative multiple sugar transport system permease protein